MTTPFQHWEGRRMSERDDDKPRRCVACKGRGYFYCDCWPGDCICGWDYEPCENCNGDGFIEPWEDWGDD